MFSAVGASAAVNTVLSSAAAAADALWALDAHLIALEVHPQSPDAILAVVHKDDCSGLLAVDGAQADLLWLNQCLRLCGRVPHSLQDTKTSHLDVTSAYSLLDPLRLLPTCLTAWAACQQWARSNTVHQFS